MGPTHTSLIVAWIYEIDFSVIGVCYGDVKYREKKQKKKWKGKKNIRRRGDQPRITTLSGPPPRSDTPTSWDPPWSWTTAISPCRRRPLGSAAAAEPEKSALPYIGEREDVHTYIYIQVGCKYMSIQLMLGACFYVVPQCRWSMKARADTWQLFEVVSRCGEWYYPLFCAGSHTLSLSHIHCIKI